MTICDDSSPNHAVAVWHRATPGTPRACRERSDLTLMRHLVLDEPRGSLTQLTFVPLAPLVGVLENRCFTTPHDGRWRRSRDSHGRLGLAHSDRVVGSRESDDSQNGVGLVAVASANLGGSGHCEWPDTCVSGQREEVKGGTRRCRDTAFAWCVWNSHRGWRERGGLVFLALAGLVARRLGDSVA